MLNQSVILKINYACSAQKMLKASRQRQSRSSKNSRITTLSEFVILKKQVSSAFKFCSDGIKKALQKNSTGKNQT